MTTPNVIVPTGPIIAIVGSRTFPKPKMVRDYIVGDTLAPSAFVITGGARRGVDLWVVQFCIDVGVRFLVIPPPGPKAGWTGTYGQACAWRNAEIVNLAEKVIVFRDRPEVKSTGSDMVIRLAQKAGKPLDIFHP